MKLYLLFYLLLISICLNAQIQQRPLVSDKVKFKSNQPKLYDVDNDININVLMAEAYERMKSEVNGAHILIKVGQNASPLDTLAAWSKIIDLRKRILNGESFDNIAFNYSEDPSAKSNYGTLGWFTAFQMVYSFENVAYQLNVGDISMPFRTQFGYHIMKLNNKRANRGEVKVQHIMIRSGIGSTPEQIADAKLVIERVYLKIQNGASFEQMVEQYSQDEGSKANNGYMNWIASLSGFPDVFKDVAFGMQAGELSKPFATDFGWHLIKLIEKRPLGTFEEVHDIVKSKVSRDTRSESSKASMVNSQIVKPKLPPNLEILQLEFSDALGNSNNLIDANENSQIGFKIKNTGKGSAYGIVIDFNSEQPTKGINFTNQINIQELKPLEERQIIIPINSDYSTEDAKIKFTIKTKEANGFDAADEIIQVESAKFLNPLVAVVDYSFSSEKGGQSKLGEVINLSFAVQNKGQGEAKNIKIECKLPVNDVFAAGETEFYLSSLKPNESKIIKFDFFPNRRYSEKNIPIEIVISEIYGKYGEKKICSVPLNTELKRSNEVVIQGYRQKETEIKQISLVADIDKNIPTTALNNPDAIAVVIGNSNYTNTKPVDFAVNDAISIKNYLIQVLGFKEGNILYKENATLGDFNTLFGTKENQRGRLANAIKANVSEVFIFYAGHGAPGLKDNKGYFVPIECNPNYVENSGYSLDIFYQNLAQLNAKSVTVILDACFSGANVYDKISPITIKVIDPILNLKNAVIITSSSGTEVSTWYDDKQHGMFTYFFLKAIQDSTHSDKNNDGVLTYQEIYDYLSDRNDGVPYHALNIHGIDQHPQMMGDRLNHTFIKF